MGCEGGKGWRWKLNLASGLRSQGVSDFTDDCAMCSPLPLLAALLGLCAWTSADPGLPFMEYLDREHQVCLKWGFDDLQGHITFQLVVNTTGWVGFGFSPNGDMQGSDLVIGGVDSSGTYFAVRSKDEFEVFCFCKDDADKYQA